MNRRRMKTSQQRIFGLIVCCMLLVVSWLWPACTPEPGKEPGSEMTAEVIPDGGGEQTPDGSEPERSPDAGPGDSGPDAAPDQGPTCDTPFTWPVETGPVTVTPHEDWKGEVQVPNDDFIHAGVSSEPRWVKFTILLKDPTKVYFQNSRKFSYHHDFVTQHLDPYKGISREEFNRIALHKKDQALVVGALVLPSDLLLLNEYGITFEREDAYHPEMLKRLYELVKSKIKPQQPHDGYYFPSFHQSASVKRLEACYHQKGVQISSIERWSQGDQCYSTGWSVGRLVEVAGKDIDDAYKEGRLKPTDILLTDGVPSEIPHVAGVISMSPTTPNSHVVILAQTFQVPFAYPRKQLDSLKGLVGKEVLLRVRGGYECKVDILDMTGRLDDATKKILEEYKKAPKIDIPAKASKGKLSTSTEGLVQGDIKYFGGKAANFGLLRKAIPDDSPLSIAFSFDLWDQFMAQKMKSGKTLREEIKEKLKDFTYPPDISKVKTTLKTIRDMIEDQTIFTKQQQTDVIAALKPFDPKRKIRFRSSTNVEDSAIFTGAGLYESKSGCLADDQDSDDKGPSLCEPDEPKERGVFRAIRKVFASFYNDNAYLERLRFGLDEDKVGMALLVHHSFPDPEEMANGVATVTKTKSGSYQFKLVTQHGATSVTNPDGNAQPEVLQGSKYKTGQAHLYITQRSSLVPFGTYVMTWEGDYTKLTDLLHKVTQAFEQANPSLTEYTLDFEYKKMKPGKLVVKQVRQVPQPGIDLTITPFFTGLPTTFCVFQGEYEDVFANYRLKSIWKLDPKNLKLDDAGRQTTLFRHIEATFIKGQETKEVKGAPASLPGAKHVVTDTDISDQFTDGSGTSLRTLSVQAQIPKLVSSQQTRILLLRDLTWYVKWKHSTPVVWINHSAKPDTRTEETVRLTTNCLDSMTSPDDILKEATFTGKDGLEIKTSYYWPPSPKGVTAGYTAPMHKWVQTEIKGITTDPIVLKDYFSQTYRPAHHNFGEFFVFTPGLSPTLSKAQRDELKAKDIESIYIYYDKHSSTPSLIKYIGFDGKLRDD